MPSTRLSKALVFLETFKTFDADANIALRSPDCRHTFAPASLKIPENDNDQFRAHVASLRKSVIGMTVTPKHIFEGGDHVTIHGTGITIFRDEIVARNPSAEWSYFGEYVFVFTFDENDKIKHILECLDSKKVFELWDLLKSANENLADEQAKSNSVQV
jgi:ketosteroid isomerase-like protein